MKSIPYWKIIKPNESVTNMVSTNIKADIYLMAQRVFNPYTITFMEFHSRVTRQAIIGEK